MLTGCTNGGKSTIFDPVDNVFGEKAVQHTPALESSMPLANLASGDKRFLYLDEFNPVEFASTPEKKPTLPKTTIKKLLAGQSLEVQVSQSFNNGNVDIRWQHGAAITAKLEGLWEPTTVVSAEDIKHFQSRVFQFKVLVPIRGALKDTPLCAASWCRWVVSDALAFGNRRSSPVNAVSDHPSDPAGAVVEGFNEIMSQAAIPDPMRNALKRDVEMLGAVHVSELLKDDWLNLPSWPTLRPLQQRRIMGIVTAA